MTVSGRLVVDGEETVLEGWRGMLGHNWGSEHAHRWAWLRGAGFAEDPTAWFDAVIGRIKVGPVTVPVDRQRRALARRRPQTDRWHRAQGGRGSRAGRRRCRGVRAAHRRDGAVLARSVGWEYADPAGDLHQVRNCSNAGMTLEVDGQRLTTTYGAVYELGTPETDPAVVMQPFPDT